MPAASIIKVWVTATTKTPATTAFALPLNSVAGGALNKLQFYSYTGTTAYITMEKYSQLITEDTISETLDPTEFRVPFPARHYEGRPARSGDFAPITLYVKFKAGFTDYADGDEKLEIDIKTGTTTVASMVTNLSLADKWPYCLFEK